MSGPHETEERFRALFDQAAVGVGLIETATGRFVRVNRKYSEIIGYSEPRMMGLDFMQITHPDDLADDLASMERLVRGEIREFAMEKRLLRSDGSIVWVALTVSPMWAVGEDPSLHIAIVQDISARRAAEQKSRDARAELESTLAALPDLMFDIDDEGRIYDFRAPSLDQLLTPPEAFLGRTLDEVLPADASAVVREAIAEALATGRSTGRRYQLDMPDRRRSYEMSLARKSVESGRPRMIAIARDITERAVAEEQRQSLEAQLRQSQKMEAVGTLAGGIAHDFNNLLAVIGLSVESARRHLPSGHLAVDPLSNIEGAARRAEELVQQILAFSRKRPTSRAVISANAALVEATKLLRATLPAGIELSVSLDDDAPNIHADATQVQQILINLGTNAWQAIERGVGTITFSVRRVVVDEEPRSVAPGVYARFRVADDGVGMSERMRERIFEPFFTTKSTGMGSGLGLSVVHGIVQEHEGIITVASEPGRGAIFDVYMKCVSAAVQPPAATATDLLRGDGASVFYVDDQVMLVGPVVRVLELLGYRATGFSSPRVALEAIRSSPGSIDLLLTDLSMPELSGTDLAREVLAIRPDLPIVLVSGFAPQPDEQLALVGIKHRLAKPFDVALLSQVLRSLLD